jgi:hypothetical protein
MDIRARLAELGELKEGWLEGKGHPPDAAGLTWLAGAFYRFCPDFMPDPRLYPTPEGNVLAEWTIGSCDISLEIDLKTHLGSWHCLDLESDREETQDLQLDKAADWRWVTDRLKGAVGEAA